MMKSPRSPLPWFFLFLLLLNLSSITAIAQVDSIRANPNAVPLRHIWAQMGDYGDEVGNIIAALPDIDGDGRDEFGVEVERDSSWTIYGMDSAGRTNIKWRGEARSFLPLMAGHFYGPDRLTLVYPSTNSLSAADGRVDFHAIDSGQIAYTPQTTWNSRMAVARLLASRYLIADLDLDGDDEFIVTAPVVVRNGVTISNGEIWIYAGGPGFQTHTPAAVIRDDTIHGNEYSLHIGRVDADEYPDLVCATFTGGRIRWGGPDITALNRPIDRHFVMASTWIHLFDGDGDGLADFLSRADPPQVMVHLSSSGKDPRTRAFDAGDADRQFVGRGNSTFVIGPLNDSASRYDMFGTNTAMADRRDIVFSGGAGGPDAHYEAWFPGDYNRISTPVGDVDGNGWRDFLCANGEDRGSAVVFGGGPYIPRDSMPASAIRDITIDGRRAAVTVWPNPAADVVHVGWRGDLHRTPARFEVHDCLGRLVAQGDADAFRGEVIWNCAERPAGVYLLSIYDAARSVIATAAITKW